jgi:hypothetical protein
MTVPLSWLVAAIAVAVVLTAVIAYAIRGKESLALTGVLMLAVAIGTYLVGFGWLSAIPFLIGLGCLVTVAEHMARRLR